MNEIKEKYGISHASGICNIIDVTTDFSIPSLDFPYVVIMSSYQETTSSAQSTKARDMIHSFEQINHRNIQHHENRAFINFIDGGGWLARIQDLKRIVNGCHYCLTIKSLDMLENIVVKHVPEKYWNKRQTN